jgi:GTP-binding protein
VAEKREALEAVAGPVMEMSGVARTGLLEVLRVLRARVDADRAAARADAEEPDTWQP